MNLLSIENVGKSYGVRRLFEQVTFGIDAGDKIGLIGVNGTGKSTLLKVIAGLEAADEGTVTRGSGVRVEFLSQTPPIVEDATVLEQVFAGDLPVMRVLREYEYVLQRLQDKADSQLERRLVALSQQMDTYDGWNLESEAKAILTQLGITDFQVLVSHLSGGQRKRVALAGALIRPTDVLILDEPTNHLDNQSIEWLEQYLQRRKGALLMITHDRYFLDRVVTKTLELDKGKLYVYSANYSRFLELKAEREMLEEAGERKRQNLLRSELAWIQRGARARSTKQKARIERFEKLSAVTAGTGPETMEITAAASRLGRKVIEMHDIGQAFDGQPVIHDFTYTILKNDRVGIIGPNGSGKSTLLDLIAGKRTPASGTIERGQTVKIGYFSQHSSDMDENMRVIDYIKEEANYITTADSETITASQMLERFLFSPALQWLPIAKLSGGEKRRLYLLRILMGSPNVLLLDEPTNDLDIQTLTILEEYLDGFAGAIITVSHDRFFLDRMVDKIFALEPDGNIRQYPGGYTDYLEAVIRQVQEQQAIQPKKAEPQSKANQRTTDRPLRFTYKEQREFDEIEDMIAGVEQELAQVVKGINTAGSNFTLLQELTTLQQQLEQKLSDLMDRWAYLSELAEKIQQQ